MVDRAARARTAGFGDPPAGLGGSGGYRQGVLKLTVIEGPDQGKQFAVPDDEPQLIGRSSEALRISDNTVSRRHAELTPDAGLWWVRDLDSHNGTFVNGRKIEGRIPVRDGDQIRAGSTVLALGVHRNPESELVELVEPGEIDADIERTLVSNEDSVILAEPEPRAAAREHLRFIYRLTTITSQATSRDELLEAVMAIVFDEFGPERGVIMLIPEAATGGEMPGAEPEPVVVRYQTPPRDPEDAKIHVSSTILRHSMSRSEGVLSSNAMNDPRFSAGDSVQRFSIRSAVCSPIKHRDVTYGAIYIDSSIVNYTFTEDQLALLNAVGQHTGLALANLELLRHEIHRQRLAAIGETVASLSHSIKNILQGLRGGADVLDLGLKKSDLKIARGGWQILRRNVDRIMALTLNMLAFSRQRHVEIELSKLGPLVEECAELLEPLCTSRQVALLTDIDQDLPPVPIDPHLMHQAILNLMTNAVEAVEAKRGAVTVRVQYYPDGAPDFEPPEEPIGEAPEPEEHLADDDAIPLVGDELPAKPAPKPRPRPVVKATGPEVEIVVIDNGPGIPADQREWIFEPFHTTKGIRGTGLGLAVTQRVIEEHEGRIEIGDTKGSGATVRIVLSADPNTMIDPSATAVSRPSTTPHLTEL